LNYFGQLGERKKRCPRPPDFTAFAEARSMQKSTSQVAIRNLKFTI
jgi:hypothetical protein